MPDSDHPSQRTHAPDANRGATHRLRRAAGPLFGLAIVALALWGLHGMLRESSPHAIAAALRALPPQRLALALGCLLLAYLALTCYDFLSLRWLGRPQQWRRSAPVTAAAFALGNVSFNAMVVGGGVRYAGLRPLGLAPSGIAQMAVFASLGFWLAYGTVGGLLFAVDPVKPSVRMAGLLLLAPAAYLLLSRRPRTLRLRGYLMTLPPLPLCAGQLAAGVAELLAMSSVLWLLLPAIPGLTWSHFMQAFLLAIVAGSASQAPGGLGVFDSAFLALLPEGADVSQAVAALLAFRVLYYLLPLLLALAALGVRSLARRRN
ncbi:hypothetical protein KTQ42_05450|uniref:YbhN family protein n=1 Tax=Noviherbaspirillum sp. L7-7A TaxID=2850560 RepID=UPI001C2CB1DA|nr:YbhN family protein [Noviherbaspirillum sp. L7-7A]MBV0878749.1 hypothetical protein [Noviherbaspirillum sp. L7-7A]